jgi:hypothetical protein
MRKSRIKIDPGWIQRTRAGKVGAGVAPESGPVFLNAFMRSK